MLNIDGLKIFHWRKELYDFFFFFFGSSAEGEIVRFNCPLHINDNQDVSFVDRLSATHAADSSWKDYSMENLPIQHL